MPASATWSRAAGATDDAVYNPRHEAPGPAGDRVCCTCVARARAVRCLRVGARPCRATTICARCTQRQYSPVPRLPACLDSNRVDICPRIARSARADPLPWRYAAGGLGYPVPTSDRHIPDAGRRSRSGCRRADSLPAAARASRESQPGLSRQRERKPALRFDMRAPRAASRTVPAASIFGKDPHHAVINVCVRRALPDGRQRSSPRIPAEVADHRSPICTRDTAGREIRRCLFQRRQRRRYARQAVRRRIIGGGHRRAAPDGDGRRRDEDARGQRARSATRRQARAQAGRLSRHVVRSQAAAEGRRQISVDADFRGRRHDRGVGRGRSHGRDARRAHKQ